MCSPSIPPSNSLQQVTTLPPSIRPEQEKSSPQPGRNALAWQHWQALATLTGTCNTGSRTTTCRHCNLNITTVESQLLQPFQSLVSLFTTTLHARGQLNNWRVFLPSPVRCGRCVQLWERVCAMWRVPQSASEAECTTVDGARW